VSNPDPLAAVFTDYTDDTSAEVRDGGTDRLWRKAKRRRIGRVAVASAATLALLVPAGWLVVNVAGADGPEAAEEQTIPPVWTAPAVGDGEDIRSDSLAPGFDALVGATVDLPSFLPGDDEVDEVCRTDGAVVIPGWAGTPDEVGAVFLKQYYTVALATDEAPIPVALLGCDYGDSTAFQVVALSHDAGQWSTVAQFAHTEEDGAVPRQLLGSGEDEVGLTIGYAERYDPGADDLDYWFESVTLDAAGDPVSEPAGDFDAEGYTDLDLSIAATETGEAGVWNLTATVYNDGPRTATGYEVIICGWELSDIDMDLELQPCVNPDCVDTGDGCPSVREAVAVIDDLGVGESFTYEWTVTIDLAQWQTHLDAASDAEIAGPMFDMNVQKDTDDVTIPRAFTRALLFTEFVL
jgi:hypothetical protein